MKPHGQIGQRRQWMGKPRSKFAYGLGCHLHPNCFECPENDCRYEGSYYHSGEEPSRREILEVLR